VTWLDNVSMLRFSSCIQQPSVTLGEFFSGRQFRTDTRVAKRATASAHLPWPASGLCL